MSIQFLFANQATLCMKANGPKRQKKDALTQVKTSDQISFEGLFHVLGWHTLLVANCNTMEGGVGYYIKCGNCASYLVRSLDTDMATLPKRASQAGGVAPFLATVTLLMHVC